MLLLGGCSYSAWGYGAVLDPGPDPSWSARVQHAADNWNDTLSTCDGPALVVGHPGHPVKTVRSLDEGVAGTFDGDSIRVLADLGRAEDAVLTHEMGHALGFDHISADVDPGSIMNPSITWDRTISESDAHRARTFFGCP